LAQESYRANRKSGFALGEGNDRFVRPVSETLICDAPATVADYCQRAIFPPTVEVEQEELWVLLLNTKNRATHELLVYRGTVSACHVRIAELFREAVRLAAVSVIIVHNHPSGVPDPSPEDLAITRNAQEAARILDVQVLDHLIIGHERWVSLQQLGAFRN
jgi:DNA repair protein RadC